MLITPTLQDGLVRDSAQLLSEDLLAGRVRIGRLAAWLAQQDAQRRKAAAAAAQVQRSATSASSTPPMKSAFACSLQPGLSEPG